MLSCFLWLVLTLGLVQAFRWVGRGSRSGSGKLPPGPGPFPVIGNLLELGPKPHESLATLAKTHGPIMSLRLGQTTAIVVSSAAAAKEFLQTHDLSFASRSIPDAVRAHDQHEFSLPFIPVSPQWRILRKICNTHVFTGRRLDESQHLRRKKIRDLLTEVQQSCCEGAEVDIGQAAFKTSLNFISNTLFSVDLVEPGSGTAQEFKDIVWGILEEAGRPNIADFFPVLSKMDPQGIRRRMTVYFGKMLELFNRMVNQRIRTRELTGLVADNDMLDTLLNICKDGSEGFERNWIERLCLDLFVAGTDTTSSTVEWAMAELLHKPETLAKAQAELRETIGKENPVEESDMARLPYLQAVVKETFRLHPAAPFLLPRRSDADVEIGGFTVPKGAQILVNAWAIGRDPNTWDDPRSFAPERFLGSEIDVKGRHFELIPFGGGRRICIGMPLAIRMVPLILGSLIHSFNWTIPQGVVPHEMSLEDQFGITLRKAQPLRAIPTPV